MRKLLFILFILTTFPGCKKGKDPIKHTVQCSSNINDMTYYSFSINGVSGNEISKTYIVDGNTDISLQLSRDGGDTTIVNSGDSLWIRGGIIVDGQLVRTYSGYGNSSLSYHIE